MNTVFNNLILNLSGQRKVKIDGQEHIVAPLTMIVPGVLNGSHGPILYTKEENDKSVPLWDRIPITLEHPDPGEVAKGNPAILNKQGIGFIRRVKSEKNLTAEACFNVQVLKDKDPIALTDIEAGNKLEVSTGLGMDKEDAEDGSVFNSVPYETIARNYDPDHLAVLRKTPGACSINDGCGVNNEQKHDISKVKFSLTNNEMSHDELHSMLSNGLRKKFTQDEPGAWIVEVFDSMIIYRKGDELYQHHYTKSDSGVTLSDAAPVKVRREVSFKPVTNEKEESTVDRDKVINGLIQNSCCWAEEDRQTLNGFDDKKLTDLAKAEAQRIHNEGVVKAATEGFEDQQGDTHVFNTETKKWEVKKVETEPKKEETEPKGEPIMNSSGQGMGEMTLTPDQWFANAPDEVKETLQYAKQVQNSEKQKIVKELVENAGIADDEKENVANSLMNKTFSELEEFRMFSPKKAPEVPESQPFFAPAGSEQIQNEKKGTPLELPTIDWSKN